MPEIIDLRGDWATPPTPAMRRAMAEAEVGDDNSHEDPTVIRLEELSAERMGKEAALFVPSGTMGNLVSVLALAEYGTEIILGDKSHAYLSEAGGAAVIGGHPFRTVPNDRFGMLDPAAVEEAINPPDIHCARTGLLMLENTHNLCGGTVLTPQQAAELCAVAHRHGIPVHLDGSRIFNAAAALGIPAADLAAHVDTVTFCLSKGLAAPVGSVVCGPADVIERARQKRKLLGGAMRQAGVIAAAGIVALEQMVDRLPEDHANARRLAEGLAEYPAVEIDLETVQTNLVFFDVRPPLTAEGVAARFEEEGIRCSVFGPRRLRFATHYAVSRADVDRVLAVARQIFA
uniref:Aminotransferase class I/II-fold pyridoxal phosphate-dependent enzyme n=1 Tax=Thermorudis peleae TaxID=1382356 RepID=A0A831X9W4_9BACT